MRLRLRTCRPRRASILLASGAVVGACAWVSGCFLTTGLDGFSGPSADDGGGGSPTEGGGGANDAPSTTNDGSAESDGSALDGGFASFRCASLVPTPTFCADFDTDGTVNTIIGAPETTAGGSVVLDTQVFRSSGRSLKLSTPSLAFGPTARASVERRFQAVPSASILVAFDLRVDSAAKDSTNTLHLNMGGYTITVFIGENAAKIRQGLPPDGGSQDYTSFDRLPPKVRDWVRVSLFIKFGAGAPADPSTVALTYDGVSNEAPIAIAIDRYKATNWSIDFGLNFVDPPDNGRTLRIDNLVVDAK